MSQVPGPQVTPRDIEMLTWIGRRGLVTPDQVSARFFSRDGGSLGQWASYRRLRKLEQLHLLRGCPGDRATTHPANHSGTASRDRRPPS